MKQNVDKLFITMMVKINSAKERAASKLKETNGNFLEEAMKYIIGAVIGILFLGGIYLLFTSVIMPGLSDKTKELFNFKS